MEKITAADRDFLRAFEDGSLGKACWNHTAHLRMAWLELERQGVYTRALDKIRSSIQRYNASQGSVGYHETVTVAFTRLMHHRRQLGDRSWNFEAFLAKNSDLLSKDKPMLERYYAREELASEAARKSFLPPSRRPLPEAGEVRAVRPEDAEAIASIYAPYVRDTAVSFELEPPPSETIRQRILQTTRSHPWCVFETAEGIVGYAYGSRHRERAAYQWTTEVSVYVASAHHRSGVGRVLYASLLAELRLRGYCLALGGISLPNEPSVRFHEAMGFEPVGVYRRIGFKFGRWHDVGWWQKSLQPEPDAPPPL